MGPSTIHRSQSVGCSSRPDPRPVHSDKGGAAVSIGSREFHRRSLGTRRSSGRSRRGYRLHRRSKGPGHVTRLLKGSSGARRISAHAVTASKNAETRTPRRRPLRRTNRDVHLPELYAEVNSLAGFSRLGEYGATGSYLHARRAGAISDARVRPPRCDPLRRLRRVGPELATRLDEAKKPKLCKHQRGQARWTSSLQTSLRSDRKPELHRNTL